jgi:outer membrane immunogenic protein
MNSRLFGCLRCDHRKSISGDILMHGLSALAAVILATVTSTVAVAQSPASVLRSSWGGLYIGMSGGYTWAGNSTASTTGNDVVARGATCGGGFGGTCIPAASHSLDMAVFGAQIGYNWHLHERWVVGLEADFSLTGNTDQSRVDFSLAGNPSTFTHQQAIDFFGTVRGRLGYLIAPDLLVFGTGGLAYAQIEETASIITPAGANLTGGSFSFGVCPAGPCFSGNSTRMTTGWTAGGGFEYMLPSNRNVSVKTEYVYIGLDGNSVVVPTLFRTLSPASASSSFTSAFSDIELHIFRLGLNVRL